MQLSENIADVFSTGTDFNFLGLQEKKLKTFLLQGKAKIKLDLSLFNKIHFRQGQSRPNKVMGQMFCHLFYLEDVSFSSSADEVA